MKIAVFGKTPESKAQLKKAVAKAGFTYDENNPDVIISYGGDGTFLWAERKYPGVPKALFRYSKICKKCHNLPIDHALALLKKRKYKIVSHTKLEARAGKNRLLGANDIVIRNAMPTHAVRFKLTVNGTPINGEFIGDGVVVATTFGSTGYFQSIARKKFTKGIGIAFNNTTVKQPPLFLPDQARIRLTIIRGEAFAVADNQPIMVVLKAGNSITITGSKNKTKVVAF